MVMTLTTTTTSFSNVTLSWRGYRRPHGPLGFLAERWRSFFARLAASLPRRETEYGTETQKDTRKLFNPSILREEKRRSMSPDG